MKLIAALFALFITTSMFAQDEVIIIDRSKTKHKSQTIKKNENTQVFKFSPTSLFDGEILFGYERQLTAKGSFDVELGPTISKIGFGIPSHYGNGFDPVAGENGGLGVVVGAAYRYYPLDETEALNRFYVSPQFRYKVYNHTVQDYSGLIPDVVRGNETMANFFFNFGYQSWLSKTFSMDFYFGIGIGQHTRRDYRANSSYNGNEWEYTWIEENRSGTRYVVNAGIKVGIGSK